VDSSLAEIACNCIRWFGNERIEKSGLSLVEASKINAPLIFECKVHLECTLHNMYIHEHGFVVLGEVVSVSMWDKILHSESEEKYELLDLTIPCQGGFCTLSNKIKPIPGFSETLQIYKRKVEQNIKEKS
jgi:flavin reductase (DIM6/NTAB) family NADH-FMN oxidoreductase RutF